MPNNTVMYWKKIAISVKIQRWTRPSKDLIVIYLSMSKFLLRMRRDRNTLYGNI